jgi:hypothetical protein
MIELRTVLYILGCLIVSASCNSDKRPDSKSSEDRKSISLVDTNINGEKISLLVGRDSINVIAGEKAKRLYWPFKANWAGGIAVITSHPNNLRTVYIDSCSLFLAGIDDDGQGIAYVLSYSNDEINVMNNGQYFMSYEGGFLVDTSTRTFMVPYQSEPETDNGHYAVYKYDCGNLIHMKDSLVRRRSLVLGVGSKRGWCETVLRRTSTK